MTVMHYHLDWKLLCTGEFGSAYSVVQDLQAHAEERGLDHEGKAHRVCKNCQRIWEKRFGPDFLKKYRKNREEVQSFRDRSQAELKALLAPVKERLGVLGQEPPSNRDHWSEWLLLVERQADILMYM